MASLGDRPTVLLVETRPEVLTQLERIAFELDAEPEALHSIGALLRRVARGGDLRMIVSKTRLVDYSPLESIDMVRRLELGARVPIVFYGSKFAGVDSTRWNAQTLFIDQPMSAVALEGLLDQIDRERRLPQLSVLDRQRFRREASGLLGL